MNELLILFIYLFIGACWVSVVDEYIFKAMTTFHKCISFMFWPFDIIMGGITRLGK